MLLSGKKPTDNSVNKYSEVCSILSHETRTKSKFPRLIKQLSSACAHFCNSNSVSRLVLFLFVGLPVTRTRVQDTPI